METVPGRNTGEHMQSFRGLDVLTDLKRGWTNPSLHFISKLKIPKYTNKSVIALISFLLFFRKKSLPDISHIYNLLF